jgi:VanZ family protein
MTFPKHVRITALLIYFIILNTLFCLPGSAFPHDNWMQQIGFDKWVHIGLIGLLSFLVSWVYSLASTRAFLILFIATGAYGWLIEAIQDQYITNRAFDWKDWFADMAGSVLGIVVWRYIKK